MDAYGDNYETAKADWERTSPLKKAATAEEVAEVAMWLIEGAPLTTGQMIVCDTGATLGTAGHAAGRPSNKRG